MDCFSDLPMNLGPRDPLLLHLQPSHRSSPVYEACGSDSQRSRQRNPTELGP